MAATDVQSLLAGQIKTEVTNALTLATVNKVETEWEVSSDDKLAHDHVSVVWAGRSREALTNESDLVRHSFTIEATTKGKSRETVGQTLSLWAEQIQEALGHRASDKSPLQSDATLSTALAARNAWVFHVEMGDMTTTASSVQGMKRHGVSVNIDVIVQELRT